MKRSALVVIFAGIGCLPSAAADKAPTTVTAQLNCDSLPAGPDRTDCYIARGSINRQQFDIAGSEARLSRGIARHRRVTAQHRHANPRAAKKKW